MPFRVLLPYGDPSVVSRGNILPARGSLGPHALPARPVQRDGGAEGVHVLPEGLYLPRVWQDRSHAVSGRNGVQQSSAYLT